MKNWLAVLIGGMLGGVSRYGIGLVLPEAFGTLATTVVNLVGSFLLAWLTFGVARRFDLPTWLILGLGTGFVGAFTTWSSLMVATLTVPALGILLLNLSLGLVCAGLGAWCGQRGVKEANKW